MAPRRGFRRFLAAAAGGCLVVACATPSIAQSLAESAANLDAEAVGALVRQLADGDRGERDDAERRLVELGPEVLPLLPAANRRMAAETLQRLERIRRGLESIEGEASLEASRLTLDVKDVSLSSVFDAIAEQTGNQFVDYRERFNQEESPSKITISCEDAPFWEVLDDVLDQAGVTLYDYPADRGAAAVVARSPDVAPRVGRAAYSGAFRVEPLRIEAIRDLRNPMADQLKATFHLMWEPRLTPIALTADLTNFVATTDDGQALGAAGAPRLDVPISPEFASVEFDLPLALPSRSARRLTQVKGRFEAIVLGPEAKLEFDRLASARNVRQQRGGVSVTLMQVQRVNPETWRLFVQVEFDETSGALESHQTWIYNNRAVLVDAAGEEATPGATDAAGAGPNSVALSYLFVVGESIDGLRFEYHTPVSVERIQVEAEIADLELP